MKQREIPERPELVRGEVLEHDTESFLKTVIYAEIDGETPEITNHFSDRTGEVVAGGGVLYLAGAEMQFEQGDTLHVPKGTPVKKIGAYSMISTMRPALVPRFVTFDDQTLSRKDHKDLKRLERNVRYLQRDFRQELVDRVVGMQRVLQSYTEEYTERSFTMYR